MTNLNPSGVRRAPDNVNAPEGRAAWALPWQPIESGRRAALLACPGCGAAVPPSNIEAHVDWHRQQWDTILTIALGGRKRWWQR